MDKYFVFLESAKNLSLGVSVSNCQKTNWRHDFHHEQIKSDRINGYCRSRYVIFRENYLGQAAFYTQKHTLLTHLFTIPKDVCVFRVEQNENKSKVCLASSPPSSAYELWWLCLPSYTQAHLFHSFRRRLLLQGRMARTNHIVCLIAVTFKPCDNDEAGGRPLLMECLTH